MISAERKRELRTLKGKPNPVKACEVAATITDNPILKRDLLVAAERLRELERRAGGK